ncbi:hypothetical protein BBJ29_004453 [Phytophthora kernoviae]|uniref:MIT domain-containing protein n=1 Tax=Phytophthora kernoviae TaxID=325452 RepID=A0A3F2S1A9_9STRA|nr:hypothetical protein BBJ29_004453 [Phytophthora kernoviae]RLN68437.1 hypothetical protein BBP00_00001057 [Phytophthora kernoviae]
MFLWRSRRPDDAIQKTIEAAVAADNAGKYEEAVELYASGIEKMMAQLGQLQNEEEKSQMRQKINEYMVRAEYLKDWTAKEQDRKQETQWVGEGEKLVRALFEMARELQPSVVFMDEIDALLSARSSSENDASRRIKNQFFTELDGAASSQEDRILIMGATNLPHELDEAIVRRLEKRIYGYSGSDLKAVCKDAALGPIRELGAQVANVKAEDVREINAEDFQVALTRVRPSVSAATIESLVAWNDQYGVSAT